MNKTPFFPLLFFFITTFSSSFARIDLASADEQNSSYSNIPHYAQQKEPIEPSQTTLKLVNAF